MTNILTKIGELKLKTAQRKKKISDKIDNITSGFRENVAKAKAVELERLESKTSAIRVETALDTKIAKERATLASHQKLKKQRSPTRKALKSLSANVKKNLKTKNTDAFSNKVEKDIFGLGGGK